MTVWHALARGPEHCKSISTSPSPPNFVPLRVQWSNTRANACQQFRLGDSSGKTDRIWVRCTGRRREGRPNRHRTSVRYCEECKPTRE